MYIETDDGKYYAGSNSLNLGPELSKPIKSTSKFGNTRNIKIFNILNKNNYNKLAKYETITPSKNRPTESDYEKGYMYRYFTQRVNDEKQIFEINKKTYDDFEKKYDTSLYLKSKLVWTLEGNVRKSNKLVLEKLSDKFKYIKSLFSVLNEFESLNTSQNLFTKGGELYYENGREYTGAYHIHPEKGPMVGAKHVEEAHDVLVWAKDLQSPNELKGLKDLNYQKFLKERKKNQINKFLKPKKETPRTSPVRSTGRSTSGGGGGGY
jgi:hypothetical protein